MPEPKDTSPTPGSPILGRLMAMAFAAFFLMVGLGVLWVWRTARREQDWRDQVQASEPILPARTPAPRQGTTP